MAIVFLKGQYEKNKIMILKERPETISGSLLI